MLIVWILFMGILFIAEPLFLHNWFRRKAERATGADSATACQQRVRRALER